MNKKIRKIINILLISALSICGWEVGKKQYKYIISFMKYEKIAQEKEKHKSVQEYLYNKDYDWIKVSDTAINYPLVYTEDNQYYLTRDYEGNEDIAGAIYYDAIDKPYEGLSTIIYGHSMRNGTMFNNLHYFPKDKERFKTSILTINTKQGETRYKPIAYDIYNANEPYYRDIDKMNMNEALNLLNNKCDYFIDDTEFNYEGHIIALVTCDYSIKDGRLVVFYVKE